MKRTALCLMLVLMSGCGKGSTPSIPKGTEIGNQHSFWTQMLPAYRPGMSWTYRRALEGTGSLSVDRLTIEVAEVKDRQALLKITGWMEPATVSVQSPTEAVVSTTASYESLGTEDVTVPYGTFKNAAKFRFDPQYKTQADVTQTLLWFAQGVGLVKTADIRYLDNKTTVVTQELIEFKK